MKDQLTRDAEAAARKLGACPNDIHENCVLLVPGEERVNGKVVPCLVLVQTHARITVPDGACARRPVFLCVDCGALVCERHAGQVCPAVDERGRPCVLRLAPSTAGRSYHHHEYAS